MLNSSKPETERDHNGAMLWAGAKRVDAMGSVIAAEAEALRWAIQTTVSFGYRNVTFETDSMVLKKMINGEEEVWPRMQPIIQAIQAPLAGHNGYEVVYYPRSGNRVADRIAKETSTFTSIVPKLYSIVPVWLNSCIEADKPSVRL